MSSFAGGGRGHHRARSVQQPVHRPGQPLLAHAPRPAAKSIRDNPTQFGRAMRQLGHRDDPGLLAGSSRTFGARLPHPPGPLTEGAAGRGHHYPGAGQPLSPTRVHSRLQPRVRGPGRRTRLAPSCPGSAATCTTSCACKKSAWCARITVWPTRTSCCRFLPIATAAITSKRKCACMNIPTAASPSFMARAAWRATTPTARN